MSSQIKNLWWKKRRRWSYKEPRSYKRYIIPAVIIVLLLPVLAFGVYMIAKQRRARLVEVNGATLNVRAGGDFQDALNRAKPGDTILLEAGATYNGSFTLPNKQGSQFITIRSSATDAQLPKPNERIEPARYGKVLPKVISTSADPAIKTEFGAHHYRFIGVEFGPTKEGLYNIIFLGDGAEKKIEDFPHHIEFDRVYVHGSPTLGQRRGIAANGKYIRITNSYIADIKRRGDESAAIGVWEGDGPIEITNNYLEAAGMCVLFGGSHNPDIQLTPTDITVRDNHMNKQVQWKEEGWVAKNLFEIKNARRVKVTNNLMTNNWASGQNGIAVLFTVRADSGEKATVEDVEFSGNIVRSSGGAVNVLGSEGAGGHRLTIRNNIFEDIDYKKWGGNGNFLVSSQWDGLIIENNIIIQNGNITTAYGVPSTGFVFRNNVVFNNEYGFMGDNQRPGQVTLDIYYPQSIVTNNAIIGGDSSSLKGQNMYPSKLEELGFVNPSTGDYRLSPNSPLKGKGVNGADIGVTIDPQKVGRSF